MENLSRRDRERKMREEEIILAAEKIFRMYGFEESSMDEIAKEAQFTKRTLYQYFPGKEDLFFAVIQKGLQKLQERLKTIPQENTTGFEKIQRLSMGFLGFYQEYPELFNLLNSVGPARQRANEESENKQNYLSMNNALFDSMAQIISEGQKDGSIDPGLDARKTAFSLIFLITGFFNQFAKTGKSFSANFALDSQDFSLFTLNLILRTLKKNSSSLIGEE